MDLNKISNLLEKYDQGTTTLAEEQELKSYFLGNNIAPEMQGYKSIFEFYNHEKNQTMSSNIKFKKPKNRIKWFSIAATITVFFGIAIVGYVNLKSEKTTTLGTYNNPETAFKATQNALSMLSKNVNVGIKNALIIQEFENSKNLIFKK